MYCNECNKEHGDLYVCKNYSKEKQAKILANGQEFRNNLQDKDWIKKQMTNGADRTTIDIFKLFAGVD